MILKSIRLRNIRSYSDAEISFPRGKVLLSGDIGSGKSSILLAMEFAFFGFLKGDLSGSALLRHGSSHGEVEIRFEINGKDVAIFRSIRRSKDRIEQDSGYIIISGVKHDATPIELKTKVLDLLGYPKDLLTKSKSLIYRYTIYTPQEDMKRILYEDQDSRINVLRKIFDVEKYRRVRENSAIYLRALKERKKIKELEVLDLEQKKQSLTCRGNELAELKSKIGVQSLILSKNSEKVSAIKRILKEQEEEAKHAQEMKQIVAVSEAQLNHKNELLKRLENEYELLRRQIMDLKKDSFAEEKDYSTMLKAKEDDFQNLQEEIQSIYRALSELTAGKHHSSSKMKSLISINKCPACFQDVSETHKQKILCDEQRIVKELDEEIKKREATIKERSILLEKVRNEISSLRNLEKQQAMQLIKKRILEEKEKRLSELSSSLSEIKKDINDLCFRIKALKETLSFKKRIEDDFAKTKKEMENALSEESKESIIYAQLVEKEKYLACSVEDLTKEISVKESSKKELEKTTKIISWIEDFLTPLTETIERHVMIRIHRLFNELFSSWFCILLEGENISAQLDENFTPLIQQNGYDTYLENLSGGEKTACALAYRLALNSAVNKAVNSIKTNDLIILDEPTDGFSSEQLDKMRDVLDQLGCRQTIIISHESKIESMVDKVIRIAKEGHESRINEA